MTEMPHAARQLANSQEPLLASLGRAAVVPESRTGETDDYGALLRKLVSKLRAQQRCAAAPAHLGPLARDSSWTAVATRSPS